MGKYNLNMDFRYKMQDLKYSSALMGTSVKKFGVASLLFCPPPSHIEPSLGRAKYIFNKAWVPRTC